MDIRRIENIDKLSMYERIDFIKEIVSAYLNIPYEEYDNPRRKVNTVKLKHYAIYFSKQHTVATLEQLSDYFGYENHSSVISLIKKIDQFLEWDKEVQKEAKEISGIIYLKGLGNNNKVNLGDFYYINMNDFTSVRIHSEKALIFVGYTEEEKRQIYNLLNKNEETFESREHKNTHKFIVEDLKTNKNKTSKK